MVSSEEKRLANSCKQLRISCGTKSLMELRRIATEAIRDRLDPICSFLDLLLFTACQPFFFFSVFWYLLLRSSMVHSYL
jgi:hypothetical protein